jgi:UvrD-like helicase family protein
VSGGIEVRVKRRGKTIATIIRPLRQLDGKPAVTFKGELRLVIDGAIEVGGTDPEVDEGLKVDTGLTQPPMLSAVRIALPPEKENLGANEQTWEDDPVTEPSTSRLIVDAGPGTGKTHAACARVAAMVNGGIPPTRVCLVSFTRTAVVEMRNRIARALSDPADAASVRIITLDAYAWAVQSGFSLEARLTGSFDDNINEAHRLIRDDPDVRDDVARIEHFIVDEAQDIVGPRAELVLAIIDALDPQSGVSVFADKAQAIYAFSENGSGASGIKLLEALISRGFKQLRLTQVHRTADPSLLGIFTHLRRDILDGCHSDLEQYVREEIQRLAHEDVGEVSRLNLAELPDDALVLMRNRMDVLNASSRAGLLHHRLRLSGLPLCIRPWVAQMLWDFSQRRISRDEFERRWIDRHMQAPMECAEAWRRCVEVAGESHLIVDLYRLRAVLARSNPPMLFCSPEFGTAGPILGTIHASKGREAPTVYLYLQERAASDETGEESRVMFVGATRPRERLLVGSTGVPHGGQTNGRAWRRTASGVQIEIGRPLDLDPPGLVGRPFFSRQDAAYAAQHAWVSQPLRQQMALRAEEGLGWQFALNDGEQRLAGMSERFRHDINDIGYNFQRRINWLGHGRSIGLRTMVVAPESTHLESMLEPWKSSGFLFAPLLTSLSHAKLRTC